MAIARCIDGGIVEKMFKDIVYEAVRDGYAERPYPLVRSDEPLTLMHLITSLMVFGVGLIVSGITFLGESIHKKDHGKVDVMMVVSMEIEKNQEDIMMYG